MPILPGGMLAGMSQQTASPQDTGTHGPNGYSAEKQALLSRLRRIEGQVRGLQRMVEQDTYCIDVLTQISAANRALQAVAVGLLEGHIAHCVVAAAQDGGDPTAKVKEASDAIARLVRS
jgi:DNA-binding FrmR family transcriptional regulator